MKTKQMKGYIAGAAAAASYGLNPAFTLPLYADGMGPESVLILRYGIAIALLTIPMFFFHRSFKVERKVIPTLIGLGFLMAASSLFLFVAYNYMAAGIASTILFVYPIFVAIMMVLFFKEKVTLSIIICLILATSGILLLYYTGDEVNLSLYGTIAVILSSISYAIYMVWAGKGSVTTISSHTLTFYVLCFGTILFIAILLFKKEPIELPSKWYLWLDVFALALIPTAFSFIFTKRAISLIGPTPTAILGALEPVTAVIVGIIFFREGMTIREAFGIALILIAVTIVVSSRKKTTFTE